MLFQQLVCSQLVDNLQQGCWTRQACYKLFQQLANKLGVTIAAHEMLASALISIGCCVPFVYTYSQHTLTYK